MCEQWCGSYQQEPSSSPHFPLESILHPVSIKDKYTHTSLPAKYYDPTKARIGVLVNGVLSQNSLDNSTKFKTAFSSQKKKSMLNQS